MQFVETARTFENGKLSVERRPATTPEEVRDAKRRVVSRDAELNLTPVSKQGFKAYVECRLAKPGSVYDFDTQSIITDAESLASYQQAVADAASCGEQDSSDDLAEVDEQDEVLVEFVRWQHLLNFTLLAELKIGSDEFEETIGWLIPREDLANLAQRGGLSWAEAKDETVRDLIGVVAGVLKSKRRETAHVLPSQRFWDDASPQEKGLMRKLIVAPEYRIKTKAVENDPECFNLLPANKGQIRKAVDRLKTTLATTTKEAWSADRSKKLDHVDAEIWLIPPKPKGGQE